MDKLLELQILPQPDDATCGPTCLHAVYRYFGDELALAQVIEEVPKLPSGGTLAVLLALHALKRGYRAHMYTYNLQMFDPTWFGHPGADLREKLRAQATAKDDPSLHAGTRAFLEYLDLGGTVGFEELRPGLLKRHFNRGIPILTGLSATYLYRTARERGWDDQYDDVHGHPAGHFVVLSGYDSEKRAAIVADPLLRVEGKRAGHYPVGINRLICSILLGVLTYDGNLLIIEPTS
jgi:hypothetical protein